MSFQQFNGYGGQASRQDDKVNIYVMGKQPVPEMVPIELRDHIHPDEWSTRLTTIRDMAFRYYKPLFERVWVFVASLVTIVLPFVLYSIIFNALTRGLDLHLHNAQVADALFKAKAISSGVFIGTIFIFWAPMLVWKMIGKRRLRNLCAGWYKSDTTTRAAGSFIPIWNAELPSVFRSTCLVKISMPPNARPSVFTPGAYLPPYVVNAPADKGAPYYYPYAAGQHPAGMPHMSVAGTLPAYQKESGKERYFEDIKV